MSSPGHENTALLLLAIRQQDEVKSTPLERAMNAIYDMILEEVLNHISGRSANYTQTHIEELLATFERLRFAINALFFSETISPELLKVNPSDIFEQFSKYARISGLLSPGEITEISKFIAQCSNSSSTLIRLKDEYGSKVFHKIDVQRLSNFANYIDFSIYSFIALLEGDIILQEESVYFLLKKGQENLEAYYNELDEAEKAVNHELSLFDSSELPTLPEATEGFTFSNQTSSTLENLFADLNINTSPETRVVEISNPEPSPIAISLYNSQKWLSENTSTFYGQWVAVRNGTLLFTANSIEDLYELLDELTEDTIVTKVVF